MRVPGVKPEALTRKKQKVYPYIIFWNRRPAPAWRRSLFIIAVQVIAQK